MGIWTWKFTAFLLIICIGMVVNRILLTALFQKIRLRTLDFGLRLWTLKRLRKRDYVFVLIMTEDILSNYSVTVSATEVGE